MVTSSPKNLSDVPFSNVVLALMQKHSRHLSSLIHVELSAFHLREQSAMDDEGDLVGQFMDAGIISSRYDPQLQCIMYALTPAAHQWLVAK
jgi:hypothetical protein